MTLFEVATQRSQVRTLPIAHAQTQFICKHALLVLVVFEVDTYLVLVNPSSGGSLPLQGISIDLFLLGLCHHGGIAYSVPILTRIVHEAGVFSS